MTQAQDTKIWFNDARRLVATQGPLLVQIWRGERTLENWAADMQNVMHHLKAQSPKGFLLLTVIESTAQMPTQQARQELAAAVKAQGEPPLGSALVMASTGMQQTMVRAAVAATRMMMGAASERLRTFTKLEEALQYLDQCAHKGGMTFDVLKATSLLLELREKKSA